MVCPIFLSAGVLSSQTPESHRLRYAEKLQIALARRERIDANPLLPRLRISDKTNERFLSEDSISEH